MSLSQISDIMTPSIITVKEEESISKVIALFEQSRISGAPVIDIHGKYTGVISKTNIASIQMVRLISEGETFDSLTAKDLMSHKPPLCVKQSDPIDNAIELMDKQQVHRVFVTDEHSNMVGIVSTLDVVSRLRYSFESYL